MSYVCGTLWISSLLFIVHIIEASLQNLTLVKDMGIEDPKQHLCKRRAFAMITSFVALYGSFKFSY